ncbi:hypothetical protein FRC01_000415 [Tulasnella sp. 417]|nr:hypothetical protein FRC01_000415 [Tulasnella sp. 417]
MLSSVQTTKLDSQQDVNNPAQLQSSTLLGLPNELLLRVISLLSTVSIPNLMANRSLRSICEQALYRSISLPKHPRRSIRLLETFLSRPDLALLVRHLEIDLSWRYPGLFPASQVPSVLQPDGLEALCLAKNIQSFSLAGVADWIWEPEMARFREVVFKLKLVRLQVPLIRDPHTEYACVWPGDSDIEGDWDGDLGVEIRKLLQAQPLLEEFKLLSSSITYKTSASLRDRLQASDILSLKSLQAAPHVALAFLSVSDRLENLNLMLAEWGDRSFSDIETQSTLAKLSVRRFTIRVWYSDEWLWKNLTKVFALFPKTEELSIAINSLTTAKDVEPANYYFEKVSNNIHVLPALRHLQVTFETLYPETPKIFEVGIGALVECKLSCPMLETVVDPKKRLWIFRIGPQSSGGFVPQLVGPLITWHPEPAKDFTTPEGTES